MNIKPKKTEDDALKFSLDTSGIEVKALAKILQDTHLAVKEIAKITLTPEPEMKVYPFKKGSFEYTLALDTLIKTFGAVVSPLALFKAYLEIKKLRLESKNGKEKVNDVLSGEVLIETLRSNTALNNSITTLLKTISENSKGVTITGNDKTSISMSTTEIKRILEIEANERILEKDEIRIIEKNEILFLVRMSKAKYGKWEFIYGDIKIMTDIDKHLKDYYTHRLLSGAKVNVRLKIWQKYNTLARTWENSRYRIIQVNSYEL